jgi:hypothetical protein
MEMEGKIVKEKERKKRRGKDRDQEQGGEVVEDKV